MKIGQRLGGCLCQEAAIPKVKLGVRLKRRAVGSLPANEAHLACIDSSCILQNRIHGIVAKYTLEKLPEGLLITNLYVKAAGIRPGIPDHIGSPRSKRLQRLPGSAAIHGNFHIADAAAEADTRLESDREGVLLPLRFQTQRVGTLILRKIREGNGHAGSLRRNLPGRSGRHLPACKHIAEALRHGQGHLSPYRGALRPYPGRQIPIGILIICHLSGIEAQVKGHADLSGLHLGAEHQVAGRPGRRKLQHRVPVFPKPPTGKHIARKAICRQGPAANRGSMGSVADTGVLNAVSLRPVLAINCAAVVLIRNGIIVIDVGVRQANEIQPGNSQRHRCISLMDANRSNIIKVSVFQRQGPIAPRAVRIAKQFQLLDCALVQNQRIHRSNRGGPITGNGHVGYLQLAHFNSVGNRNGSFSGKRQRSGAGNRAKRQRYPIGYGNTEICTVRQLQIGNRGIRIYCQGHPGLFRQIQLLQRRRARYFRSNHVVPAIHGPNLEYGVALQGQSIQRHLDVT